MEGVQCRSGDEGGLVRDPEVSNRVEGVGEDNSLQVTSVVFLDVLLIH